MTSKKPRWVSLEQKQREQYERDEAIRSLSALFRGSVEPSVVKQVAESVDYDLEVAATLLSELAGADGSVVAAAKPLSELAAPVGRKDKLKFKSKLKGQPKTKHSLQEFWSVTKPDDEDVDASVDDQPQPIASSGRSNRHRGHRDAKRPEHRNRPQDFDAVRAFVLTPPGTDTTRGSRQTQASRSHVSARSSTSHRVNDDANNRDSAPFEQKVADPISRSEQLLQEMFADTDAATITQGIALVSTFA